MVWRGPRTVNDPALTTPHWRITVRNHWKRLRLPCARCGRRIDYDGPRYLPNGRHGKRCKGNCAGCRTLNPRYLCIGHKVDRYTAKRAGWTAEQIHAISQTQPECQDCSNRSGARLGQKIKAAQQAARLAARSKPHPAASRW